MRVIFGFAKKEKERLINGEDGVSLYISIGSLMLSEESWRASDLSEDISNVNITFTIGKINIFATD